LIDGCLVNDRRAQEQLYRQLYEFAMQVAMRYSRDEMDAGDILSRAFLKMFKSMSSFDRAKGSLHAWVKRIIINEALDHIKQRSRFTSIELEKAEEPSIDNAVIQQMDAAGLMQLVSQLPPATHAVFVLYVLDGHTHKQIAAELDIKEGTSKWHLSEARRILQQKISERKTE
jgi:RNA polymerase sigma factor (sigma-70 family)